MNIQLATGELIAISQSGRPLEPRVYQEIYQRYNIREDQLELVFNDTLYEGPARRS